MGMFYDTGSSSCKLCDANCMECTGSGIDNCLTCIGGFRPFLDGTT